MSWIAAGCLWLLITGGEPLIRPDFLDVYTHAKRKGLIITLFTNGTTGHGMYVSTDLVEFF